MDARACKSISTRERVICPLGLAQKLPFCKAKILSNRNHNLNASIVETTGYQPGLREKNYDHGMILSSSDQVLALVYVLFIETRCSSCQVQKPSAWRCLHLDASIRR